MVDEYPVDCMAGWVIICVSSDVGSTKIIAGKPVSECLGVLI